MPKEDMIQLVETLAALGSKIISYNWKVQEEPPFGWEIDLKIIKTTTISPEMANKTIANPV